MSEKHISNRVTLWSIGVLAILVIILFFGVFNLDHRLTTFEQKAEFVEWGVTDRIGNLELTGFSEGEWVCDKEQTVEWDYYDSKEDCAFAYITNSNFECLKDHNETIHYRETCDKMQGKHEDFCEDFNAIVCDVCRTGEKSCVSWVWKKVKN